jgi:hypothetical protein
MSIKQILVGLFGFTAIVAVLLYAATYIFAAGTEAHQRATDANVAKQRLAYSPASAAEIQAATVDPCMKQKATNRLTLGTSNDEPRYIRKLDLEEFAASCKATADTLVIVAAQKKVLEGNTSK